MFHRRNISHYFIQVTYGKLAHSGRLSLRFYKVCPKWMKEKLITGGSIHVMICPVVKTDSANIHWNLHEAQYENEPGTRFILWEKLKKEAEITVSKGDVIRFVVGEWEEKNLKKIETNVLKNSIDQLGKRSK